MKFSLIMATYGRDKEIAEFCESLYLQNFDDYELIIIDQNDDDRVKKVLLPFKYMNIKYIHSDVKGLSINRNIGLKIADGDIICFPDDDCVYPKGILNEIRCSFLDDYDFYAVNLKNFKNPNSKPFFSVRKANISFFNFLKTGCSFTFFIRKEALLNFSFDEELGVGARFGSGEESDMILHLLYNKKKGFYDGTKFISHPDMDFEAVRTNRKRNYNYGLGYGALFKKACFFYNQLYLFVPFIFSLCKCIVGIMLYDPCMYGLTLKGRIQGFLQYKIKGKAYDSRS